MGDSDGGKRVACGNAAGDGRCPAAAVSQGGHHFTGFLRGNSVRKLGREVRKRTRRPRADPEGPDAQPHRWVLV